MFEQCWAAVRAEICFLFLRKVERRLGVQLENPPRTTNRLLLVSDESETASSSVNSLRLRLMARATTRRWKMKGATPVTNGGEIGFGFHWRGRDVTEPLLTIIGRVVSSLGNGVETTGQH